MRYRVKAGKHKQYGLTYHKGDIIDTGIDLSKLFRGKFEQVVDSPESAPTGVKLKPAKKGKKGKKGSPAGSEKAPDGPRGKDVTDLFPALVGEEGITVFRRGAWHHIYQGTDEDATPINPKGLKKKEVIPFFEKWEEE